MYYILTAKLFYLFDLTQVLTNLKQKRRYQLNTHDSNSIPNALIIIFKHIAYTSKPFKYTQNFRECIFRDNVIMYIKS